MSTSSGSKNKRKQNTKNTRRRIEKNPDCGCFLSGSDQLTDRIAEGGELLLVLRHDIAFIEHRIVMQISGGGVQMPAGFRDLLQGKGKKILIVGLELQTSLRCENFIVAREELTGGETALGVSCPSATDRKSLSRSGLPLRDRIPQRHRRRPCR